MSRDEGSSRRGGLPSRLSDLLPSALERMGPKGVWSEARVRKAWTKAVGGPVAEHAWVWRLRGTTLEVGFDDEPWGSELRFMSSVLMDRINAVLGEPLVREVVVRRGRRGSSK